MNMLRYMDAMPRFFVCDMMSRFAYIYIYIFHSLFSFINFLSKLHRNIYCDNQGFLLKTQ